MHQLRHVRAHLPRAPLPDNRTKCQSFQCHRGHPMKPTILTICTIACIALTGCGDVSYQYEGGAGITPSTNLPQEDYCDQGIAPGTVRCTADGTMVKVEICIGTKWVPNEHIWCDEGCDGEGNCKKPTASELISEYECNCADNQILCGDVHIELSDSSIICNPSIVKCSSNNYQFYCADDPDNNTLIMQCAEYEQGAFDGSEPFAEIKCEYGCSDNKCNECGEDDTGCPEDDITRMHCDTSTHRCVECVYAEQCTPIDEQKYDCVDNKCVPIEIPCDDESEDSCVDKLWKHCVDGNWQYTICSEGCDNTTTACATGVCNKKQEGKSKCSDDGTKLLTCTLDETDEKTTGEWEVKTCPFGCVNNACVDKCGTFDTNENGGTYYVCNEANIMQYRKIASSVASLVFVGKIECKTTECFNIPVSSKLKSISGINNASFEGGNNGSILTTDSTIFNGLNDKKCSLEQIKDLTFRDIETSAKALIAADGKALTLSGITLEHIKVNTGIANTGSLFGSVPSDSNGEKLILENIVLDDVIVATTNTVCGGLLGDVQKNIAISGVTIKSGFEVSCNGFAGGLFGKYNGVKTVETDVDSIADVNITNNNEYNTVTSNNSSAGGLIGNIPDVNANLLNISNVEINWMEVKGKSNAGGLLGNIYTAAVSDTILKNINLNGSNGVGGVVGIVSDGDSTLSSVSLDNITVGPDGTGANDGNGGGIIGYHQKGTTSISDISISNNLVVTGKQKLGGLAGTVASKATLSIENVRQTIKGKNESTGITVSSENGDGGYVGGLVGYVEGTLSISDVDIKRSSVVSGNNFAGGVVGASANPTGGKSNVTLRNINNHFVHVGAKNAANTNQGAGGIAGSLTGNVRIEDVINRCTTGKEECVQADNNAAGFIGTLSNLASLSINDVINEVNAVKANSQNTAGFIAKFVGTANKQYSINNVISNVKSISGGDHVGGFIAHASFNGNTSLSNLLILSTLNIYNEKSAGFIENAVNYTNLVINGVLVNAETYKDNIYITDRNLFNTVTDCNFCPQTDDDYSNYTKSDTCSNKFMSKLSNVYYVTPGWLEDNYRSTLKSLASCGSKNGRGSNEQCVFHRDYKRPILSCWFTDYIYQSDFTISTGTIDKPIDTLSSASIPIKPYHPYSAKIEKNDSDFKIDESSTNTKDEFNNINAVLDELNTVTVEEDGLTTNITIQQWIRCSDFINPSNATQGKEEQNKLTFNYDNLLCPQLLGERTCLKTSGCSNAFGDDSKE